MAKYLILTKYFGGAVSTCLELTFYVNEINILHLLTDVRRKGSNKHKVWRMFRVKKEQKEPTVTLYGKCRRKKGQLEEREESRCMGKASLPLTKFNSAHFSLCKTY